jgi:hypothetical protein
LWRFPLLDAMSRTKNKFWPEPSPIYYVPKHDPKLFKVLWEQWRRQGLLEAYKEAQERLWEMMRRRVRPLGPDEKG